MAQEFDRDTTFTDWKKVSYSLRQEWEYVNGPARATEGCTPGTRDANNDGKTPQMFLDEVNHFIKGRRSQGYGKLIPEERALLTLDELLGLRLYSGPAYQMLNGFLRQVSI